MRKSHAAETVTWPRFAHHLNFREARWRVQPDPRPRRLHRKSVVHQSADLRIYSLFPTLSPSNQFFGIRLKVVAGPPLAIACHKALGDFPGPLTFFRVCHEIRFAPEL